MGLIAESKDYIRGGRQKDEYTAAEVIEVPCPLCGSADRERLYTEHGVIGTCQCSACSLIYTSPRIQSPEQVYRRHPRQGQWDAYEHLVHYTDQTLMQVLAKSGFTVVRISTEALIQPPTWHQHAGHYYAAIARRSQAAR